MWFVRTSTTKEAKSRYKNKHTQKIIITNIFVKNAHRRTRIDDRSNGNSPNRSIAVVIKPNTCDDDDRLWQLMKNIHAVFFCNANHGEKKLSTKHLNFNKTPINQPKQQQQTTTHREPSNVDAKIAALSENGDSVRDAERFAAPSSP